MNIHSLEQDFYHLQFCLLPIFQKIYIFIEVNNKTKQKKGSKKRRYWNNLVVCLNPGNFHSYQMLEHIKYSEVRSIYYQVHEVYYIDLLKKVLAHPCRKWLCKRVEEITASQQCTISYCCGRHNAFGQYKNCGGSIPHVLARSRSVWFLAIFRSQKTLAGSSLWNRYIKGPESYEATLQTACKQWSGSCFSGMETEMGKVHCYEAAYFEKEYVN